MDLVPPLAIRFVLNNARFAAGVFILAALAALSGCASLMPQTKELAKGLPAGLPEKVELTGTPFFPQTEYQCGPAALATVLNAAGVKVTAGSAGRRPDSQQTTTFTITTGASSLRRICSRSM